MHFSGMPVMRAEDFRRIKEFVAEQFGLVLDEGRESFLAQKLVPRLTELRLTSFADYYAYLKYSPHSDEEQQQFISLLTNNETYFFREDAQLDVLAREILPALKEKKLKEGKRTLRIVSAGCSSGEEVYTLAMILLESGHFLWDWDIAITGVDIDARIIARADLGIYSGRAFQTTPPHFIERYFNKAAEGLQVKDSLRKITSFARGNLLQLGNMLPAESADIIFCRNVLIYFSEETTRQMVASFAKILKPEGLLFLGHSESLARISTQYVPTRFPGAIIYRKRD
ncbi:MAG: methyltransferase, CheR-type [Deltaproteobacteria bacterium]|nr:methyltransferase, CheR-type [Deltaproteobacteria bacterium]